MGLATSFCTIAFQTKDKWAKQPAIQRRLSAIVPLVAAHGYDGVEIWEPHYGAADPGERDAARAAIAEHRLAVPMVSGYYNFTKTPAHARESMARARGVLAGARELGARGIRIFTGGDRGGDASGEQWHRCVRCLQELCDEAAADDIALCAEIHDWNLMDTVDNCLRLAEGVDRANFGFIFHSNRFGDGWRSAVSRLAPHLRHVHLQEREPLALARTDYEAQLRALLAHGFDGFASVEYFGPEPERALADNGRWLNRLRDRLLANAA